MKRLGAKVERISMAVECLAEGVECHSWDNMRKIKKTRWRQIQTVWLTAEGLASAKKRWRLRQLCMELYEKRKMEADRLKGGYPSAHALYQYCHDHRLEFPPERE